MEEPFVDSNPPEEMGSPTEGFAKEVHAEQLNFGPGLTAVATAGQDFTLTQGGAGVVAVGRDAEVSKGYVQVMAVGHDVDIDKGGAQVVIAGHDVQIENGVALVSVSQSFSGQNTFAGFVLSPKVELGEGSRVLFNTPQAIAFGVAAGLVFTVFRWVFGKK